MSQKKILFNVVFHHGGEFVKDNNNLFYRGGVDTLVSGQNIEKWSMFEILNLVKGWGYIEGSFRAWTKIDEIDINFFQLSKDDDAYDLAVHASQSNLDGHIYVEHQVNDIKLKVREPQCIDEMTDMEGSFDSSDDDDDSAEGFDDSEDERTTALNDGFEVNPTPVSSFLVATANKKVVVHKGLICSSKKKVEDDDYFSEELGSSDPDESDDDKGPKFEKFRKDQLNKDYEFKWGMEFNSLADFRDAIREWSVLNGREITFVKNESYRVRVECKAKCGFLALCSKVGHKHTYAIKTWVGTHTCARVLNNRSANSKWVAKAVVNKMQTSEKVRICDIMQDMRQNYSVGITVGRAWKEKMIAKNVIEGDADKQYAMIWRYAAELKRVCAGNTVKINVERPDPSIQPRFGSFYFCFDGCKKGFIHGCRPFVGVDGCHLKTKYGGQLLIAVGRDPNDQYFPLAFGVVETETKESWRWFLQLLMEDIGQDRKYVFILDQEKVNRS